MGHMKFRDLVNQTLSPEARARAHEMAQEELAKMELAELRERAEVTQVEMAVRLKTAQGAVSRLEHQKDMKLSTLGDYVHALGGRLVVQAVFPGRAPIQLTHLATTDRKKAIARVRRAR